MNLFLNIDLGNCVRQASGHPLRHLNYDEKCDVVETVQPKVQIPRRKQLQEPKCHIRASPFVL